MNIDVLKNDRRIIRAASKFAPWRRDKKLKLTYMELLVLFAEPKRNFARIGRMAGVSRERIRQIYNSHFKDFLEV